MSRFDWTLSGQPVCYSLALVRHHIRKDTGPRITDDMLSLSGLARIAGELEIPMESFTRAVEIALKDSEWRDSATYRPRLIRERNITLSEETKS